MTSVDRIQGLSGSLAVKAPVRAATTAAITLSGEQTVDGVAVVEGDRVLVKDQASAVDNGIYDVSTGGWTRALDFNGSNDVVDGTLVVVTNGTSANLFSVSGTNPITPGTSAISILADRSFGQDGLPTVEVFDGGGSTFVLSQAAEVLANVELYISGVCQRPTTDFTYDNGTLTVTTTSATPAGTGNVMIRYNRLRTLGAIESDSGTFVDLTATGLFTSRGLDDNATATALTLSGSGANSVTIANSATNPTIGTSAGSLLFTSGGLNALLLTSPASAVNYVSIASRATGNGPSINAVGADGAIPLYLTSKGSQSIFLSTNGGATAQVAILDTASANRYITLTGSNGGNPVIGTSAGDLKLAPYSGTAFVDAIGTGSSSLYLTNNSGTARGYISATNAGVLNISSTGTGGVSLQTGAGTPQALVTHTASANRYITLTGSNGGNPTIGTSAGSLAISSNVEMTGNNIGTLLSVATTAGGSVNPGIYMGSAAVGIYWGSGAPTIAASRGSLYLRTDGTTTNNRMYVNTNGGTTWTAVTTAA